MDDPLITSVFAIYALVDGHSSFLGPLSFLTLAFCFFLMLWSEDEDEVDDGDEEEGSP